MTSNKTKHFKEAESSYSNFKLFYCKRQTKIDQRTTSSERTKAIFLIKNITLKHFSPQC